MDNSINVITVIPSRYASSRLPGKPLLDIAGKSLIRRVYEAAASSSLTNKVVVATDDKRIYAACLDFGADCIMTPSSLPSGTDRVWNAYCQSGEKADLIINLQGDEPLITGRVLDYLIEKMITTHAPVGTLAKKISTLEELQSSDNVKIVFAPDGRALYFSRSIIPFVRGEKKENLLAAADFFKHIGIYAFTPSALEKFISLPQSRCEKLEKLEQLRLLENGIPVYCFETNIFLIGIDTPDDYEKAKRYFLNNRT